MFVFISIKNGVPESLTSVKKYLQKGSRCLVSSQEHVKKYKQTVLSTEKWEKSDLMRKDAGKMKQSSIIPKLRR